jgi:hypothetical protein
MAYDTVIAIDPGSSGAIAFTTPSAGKAGAEVLKMPATARELLSTLSKLRANRSVICYIENVGGYIPGNSAPAAVKFGRHMGHLDMAVIALAMDTNWIVPAKWMRTVVPGMATGLSKPERKLLIKMAMQQDYEHLKVTLVNADALGLLSYALMQ